VNGGTPWPWRRFARAERSSRYGAPFFMSLTLRTRHIQGNSPRGSSNGGGNRSRARDAGQLAPTFDDVEDELQRSADDEIRLRRGGATVS
jgi:hypothetical protein